MIRDMFKVPDAVWEKNIQYMYVDDCDKLFIAIPKINKVIYDIPNNTTIVYFEDGTKEIARVMDGDTFDKEVGVMQCIVKKMYGSRSKWLKTVIDKCVEVKSKKVNKKINRDVADEFINGKIAVVFENSIEKDSFKTWIRSTTTLDLTYDSKDVINNCYCITEAVHAQDGMLFYDNLEYLKIIGIHVVDYQWFSKSLKKSN